VEGEAERTVRIPRKVKMVDELKDPKRSPRKGYYPWGEKAGEQAVSRG